MSSIACPASCSAAIVCKADLARLLLSFEDNTSSKMLSSFAFNGMSLIV